MKMQQNSLNSLTDGNSSNIANSQGYKYYGTLSGPDTQGTLMPTRRNGGKCGCQNNYTENRMPLPNPQQYSNRPPQLVANSQQYVNRQPPPMPPQLPNASAQPPYPNKNVANYPPMPPKAPQK